MSDRPTLSAVLSTVLSVSTASNMLIQHLNALVVEARGQDIQIEDEQRNLAALLKAMVDYSNAVRNIVYARRGGGENDRVFGRV